MRTVTTLPLGRPLTRAGLETRLQTRAARRHVADPTLPFPVRILPAELRA